VRCLRVALAFLIDFVLDRTIKRSGDVERHLGHASIPDIPNLLGRGLGRLPWD